MWTRELKKISKDVICLRCGGKAERYNVWGGSRCSKCHFLFARGMPESRFQYCIQGKWHTVPEGCLLIIGEDNV